MHDYVEQITKFIKASFEPSDPNRANFKRSTDGVLQFLFQTFPEGCISDYELNEILLELGYVRHTWTEDHISFSNTEDDEITTINKEITSGWCMQSELNLEPDVFKVPKDKWR